MSSSNNPLEDDIPERTLIARLIIEVNTLRQRQDELERYILTTREATLIMTRAGEDYLRLRRSRPTKTEQGRR